MKLLDTGSAPDRIRTCDLRFRRPTLYPTELRARGRTLFQADDCKRRGHPELALSPEESYDAGQADRAILR